MAATEHRRWLDDDRWYVTTLGAFLVQTGDRTIIVDLGFGQTTVEIPDFAWAESGRLLTSLSRAGVSPDQVATVLYTHLHSDHAGWTTSGADRALTFPRATHLIGSDAEWQFWRDNPRGALRPRRRVRPRPAAGSDRRRHRRASSSPGVNLMATPGHTPGHQTVVISSGSDRAVVLGDILHCPAQIAEPEWTCSTGRRPCPAHLGPADGRPGGLEHDGRLRALPGGGVGRVLRGNGRRSWQIG